MQIYPVASGALGRRADAFIRSVDTTIITYGMLKKGDAVLAGVSGGPDSVAMIDVLAMLAHKYTLTLGVAHVNHSLRPKEAEADARFTASFARMLNLPFFSDKIDVHLYRKTHKLSLEEAARQMRYTFLNRLADKHGFQKIALGHHADDNAELVLMFLLRGSGSRGLSGIPPMRQDRIIRPLIQSSRMQIMDYLKTRGLSYVMDSTNTDTHYLRNRVRRDLIPELKKAYNPRITHTLNRLAAIMEAENQWMEGETDTVFRNAVVEITSERVSLSVSKVKELHVAVLRRLIRRAVGHIKGDLRRIAYTHVTAGIHLLRQGRPGARLDFPEGVTVSLDDDALIFSRHNSGRFRRKTVPEVSVSTPFHYEISPGESVSIKEIGVNLRCDTLDVADIGDLQTQGRSVACLDAQRLAFPLFVRRVLPGDRFKPLGMTGTQKVKKYFSSHKIKPAQRKRGCVLLSRNKIVWLVGHRIDDRVKITSSTVKLLKVEYFLIEPPCLSHNDD